MSFQQFLLNLDYDWFSVSWICFAIEFHFRLDNISFKGFEISQPKVIENSFSLKLFKILKNYFVLQYLNCFKNSIEFEIFKEWIFHHFTGSFYFVFKICDWFKVIPLKKSSLLIEFYHQKNDCWKKDFYKILFNFPITNINQNLFVSFFNQMIPCFQRKSYENASFCFDLPHYFNHLLSF
jgi:hypothetical protein